jgi:hypothetical protein
VLPPKNSHNPGPPEVPKTTRVGAESEAWRFYHTDQTNIRPKLTVVRRQAALSVLVLAVF